jgi:hypothetical protein
MNPIDTRVQMLALRAPDEATAQRISALVEEAIRMTAANADIPGSVFVVRQLDLSAIPRAASPAVLSHAVDVVVERVVANAVSADDPNAATAPMVYFKDDSSIVVALAQRVATNRPATEWFWPSVVKDWTPATPVDRAISLLIDRALSTSGGVVTLARVVEVLASTGMVDKLLERLTPSDGRALLAAIGWTESMVAGVDHETAHVAPRAEGRPESRPESRVPSRGTPVPERVPAHGERLVQRWVARWGGDSRDPRAVWLGAMLLVADRPGRATSGELPESVRVWLASVIEQARDTNGDEHRQDAAAQSVRREDLIADARAWLQTNPRSPLDSLFGGGPPLFRLSRESTADEPVERRAPNENPDEDDSPRAELPTWRNPRSTPHAGFLLLVPLLTRVGLTNIVAGTPDLLDRDWPAALLLRLARRLAIPHDDPAVVCVAARPSNIAHVDRALTAEVLRALRIRLRNEARLTLRALVRRDGTVVASPTTIDVLLHHSAADAVGTASLDADPPEAPWLGRSVVFHRRGALDVNA